MPASSPNPPPTSSTPSRRVAANAAPAAIRLPVNFFEQAAIRILHGQKDGVYVVHLFLMLLSLAAKANRGGELLLTDDIPYDETIIASLVPLDTKQIQPAPAVAGQIWIARAAERGL